MIKGMPNIPDLMDLPNPDNLVNAGIDALISFGGGFAINMIFGDRWGIFNQYGVPVLLADNVTSVEYRNTATIASAPLEKGTFTSYNKVQDPYTATVQMTKGGGNAAMRGLFIAQLETLSKSTLLFNVLTPEYVHMRAAITGFSYKRSPTDAARIIVANIDLKEVREITVGMKKIEVAVPADTPVVVSGDVPPKPVPESILSAGVKKVEGVWTTVKEKAISMWNDFWGKTK